MVGRGATSGITQAASYPWTTYVDNRQSPSGSGGATGAMVARPANDSGNPVVVRCKKIRVGIANGTLTQQDGANFSNRLVMQLYVAQEMIDHPDASLACHGHHQRCWLVYSQRI